MFFELVRAAIFGALPVGVFTFLTLQWSISSGRLGKFTDKKDLKQQFKNVSDAAKEAKKKAKEDKKAGKEQPKKPIFHERSGGDFLHGKIMSFGGGFYGTMALLTYVLIEIVEIAGFLGKIVDLENWRLRFSIDFIVDLIINSIMNLVAAFIWFITLPDYIPMEEELIWLGAAYLGYLSGLRFTREHGDEAWAQLGKHAKRLNRSHKPAQSTPPAD